MSRIVIPGGSGFLGREMVTVCLAWEAAFHQASAAVERTVLLRIGIGLGGRNDPATAKLAQLVRFGLGRRVGTGVNGCPGLGSTIFSQR